MQNLKKRQMGCMVQLTLTMKQLGSLSGVALLLAEAARTLPQSLDLNSTSFRSICLTSLRRKMLISEGFSQGVYEVLTLNCFLALVCVLKSSISDAEACLKLFKSKVTLSISLKQHLHKKDHIHIHTCCSQHPVKQFLFFVSVVPCVVFHSLSTHHPGQNQSAVNLKHILITSQNNRTIWKAFNPNL